MVRIVYLEAFIETDENKNNGQIDTTLETCIVLFLLKFLDQPSHIKIHLIPLTEDSKTNLRFPIRRDAFDFIIQAKAVFQATTASQCNFPVFMSEEIVIIAGVCGVCRALIKASDQSFRNLLGFKESCLLAPSEASPWTKFCEIDMIKATKQILNFHHQISDTERDIDVPIKYPLPKELACFESHMNQPVRVHNIQKVAQNLAKKRAKNNRNLIDPESTVSIEDTAIDHKYVEDLQISIADILLYPNFHFIMNACNTQSSNTLDIDLPLTMKWMNTVQNHPRISQCLSILNGQSMIDDTKPKLIMEYIVINVDKFSLYKHEPKRYKSKNQTFTRQEDIDRSLQKINGLGIEFTSVPMISSGSIDWRTVPFEALPEGGNLPKKRLQRKKDQLNGLASEIIKIARNGDCVIDFCSGAGHLGILLAYLLPSCKIYLLENKEESLMRAKQRVQHLQLTNVLYFQCNLDYFIGRFDIGTSLHACGVASDIVLLHCMRHRAQFVCCPCCYGQCNEMPHISYPRSKFFRKNDIQLNDYLYIAHCADQAHSLQKTDNKIKSLQGQLCMDIIDTDRKLYTEECGYRTTLTRLYPEDCTPKNRLLIGII